MSASDSKPAQAQPYRSAFEEFKPFSETRDADWRAANERVRATGGHSGALAHWRRKRLTAPAPRPPILMRVTANEP